MYSEVSKSINKAVAGLNILPVHYPGVKFNHNNTDYLRFTLLPIPTLNVFLGDNGSVKYEGLVQLDIFVPNSKGLTAAYGYIDSIESYFYQGRFFDCVRIGVVSVDTILEEDGWIQVPISIIYSAYKDKILP